MRVRVAFGADYSPGWFACIKTQAYVAELKRGVHSDRATERELAFAWQQASSAFYGLDGPLAERLQLKGEYWTQPESWTDAQVRDANISLQYVAEHARQLLHESKL